MGRKVHPIGFRLGINQPWEGRWFAEGAEYRKQLHQDIVIRKMVSKEAEKAGISTIEIERFGDKVKVSIHTAKPGILIGRKGDSVKKIRTDLEALTGKKIDLEIKEIKAPDCDALLVAKNIAGQIERRVSYRRAMKRALQQAMRQGAEGIKVSVSGRLVELRWLVSSGCVMAGFPWQPYVPISISRAHEALTQYGRIGVKVWVYKGEVLPGVEEKVEATEGVYVSE